MGATGALGKHPSTVTYGWTVTKLTSTEMMAVNVDWSYKVSKATKPVQFAAARAMPTMVMVGGSSATVMMALLNAMVVPGGEADPESFLVDMTDNRNTASVPTVDAVNKNEHVTSSNVAISAAGTEIRVSQAFILQTADNKYKTLPKAYFAGAGTDVKFEQDVKKEKSLLWAT